MRSSATNSRCLRERSAVNLWTKQVGVAGVTVGGTSIVGALVALFSLLSDTTELYNLTIAGLDLKHHQDLTSTDLQAIIKLASVTIALLGAILISLVAAWLGKSPLGTNTPSGGST